MYSNRIYIEKFYCTYILSITSVTSYHQCHQAHRDTHALSVSDLHTENLGLLSRYGIGNVFTQLMSSHTKIDVV